MFIFCSLWTQITFEFNNASGRDSPSTKDQLIKVARAIRSSERKSLDTDFIDRANQSKFKASCSQTGGGQSDPPPKSNYSLLYFVLQLRVEEKTLHIVLFSYKQSQNIFFKNNWGGGRSKKLAKFLIIFVKIS